MADNNLNRLILCLLLMFIVYSPQLLFAVAQESDLNLDSDGDGLSDWDERNRYKSNPNAVDSDGDTIQDGKEVRTGTSPLLTDSDGDFISDTYEYAHWNPLAPDVKDRYHLCPYVADLPNLALNVVDDRIVNHYTFTKGSESRQEAQITSVSEASFQSNWGFRMEQNTEVWSAGWARLGLMSQDVGFEFEITVFPGVTLGFGANAPVVMPYVELMAESGVSTSLATSSWWNTEASLMTALGFQGSLLWDSYTENGWELSAATLIADISITNTFDRTVRIESGIFDIVVGGTVYQSAPWDLPELVLGQGESYTLAVTFPMEGEEWISWLTTGAAELSINPNALMQSVWDDEGNDWVSQSVMIDHIQEACALVEIVGPSRTVRKYVTATVDKIDHLNVLRALDLLFIDYTYKYGRMLDLMGTKSKPGEEVWAFAYWDRWYDPESISDETNFEELRMWGRGALTLDLQRDSDGDWLIDSVERRVGTNFTKTDTDDDYADDYVEIVLTRSNPFVRDTDGGGTIDGIEYYEGLDPNDPLDDNLELPEWYRNHATIQNAEAAANVLLARALSPEPDQLTWYAPQSPAENVTHEYEGIVTYVMNTTLGQVEDETVECIDIGDADDDGDNDIVVGTSPDGLVILYENITTAETSYFNYTILANFSEYYSDNYVRVTDVVIGKPIVGGATGILAGSWYYDTTDKGDVVEFSKGVGGWTQSGTINSASIPGGVYSLAIGDIGKDPLHSVVVGQGGSESLDNCNVTVYYRETGVWKSKAVAVTNQSRVAVSVGDYDTTDFDGNEIIYCTYSDNSTLGYVAYKSLAYGGPAWYNRIIDNYTASGPPYTRFMWARMGDIDGDETEELAVAIDRDASDSDSIEFYVGGSSSPVVEDIEFVGRELVFDDFDNDGVDEIAYAYSNTTMRPVAKFMLYDWNGTHGLKTFVENTKETSVSAMTTGDMDGDNDLELLYGTDGNGWLVLWDHPEGALWASEIQNWIVNVTLPEPWIYEGEPYPVTVTVHNLGEHEIENLKTTIQHDELVKNYTKPVYVFNQLEDGVVKTHTFLFWPDKYGNYTLKISLETVHPAVLHYSEYTILVRPWPVVQAQIGQALLDLAIETGSETLLDAASKVGNWLDTVKVEATLFYGWNADANITDMLLPGYIIPTVRTGTFLMNLFRVTGDVNYLLRAIGAARHLDNVTTTVATNRLAFSLHERGVIEAAEAGEFLMEINEELLFDLFTPTVKGLANYLCSIAQTGPTSANWYDSPGLTQAAAHFLARVQDVSGDPYNYKVMAQWASNWLTLQDETWFLELSPSIRPESPYNYYDETGLAAVGLTFADLKDQLELNYTEELTFVGNELVKKSYLTGQGRNWREPAWTTDVDDLIQSVNWDHGAAGAAVALAEAFRDTGNQTYMDCFEQAVTWMGYSIPFIGDPGVANGTCELALADIIKSMLHIHSIIPVIFVGYFVDPMTSLSGQTFVLSGYVQTLGWWARGVNLTANVPEAFILDSPVNPKISVGTIAEPSVEVVTWDITLLLHGTFNITIDGESRNAGDQENTAKVEVTDLGVSKIATVGGGGIGGFVALSLQEEFPSKDLANLGEGVVLPIEALYADTDEPAYNASIQVGEYGTAVVNGSGIGYFVVTSYEPGTVEIPITIKYDKKSGITDGTSNITVSLTFTSLEVTEANVSDESMQVGQPITFGGKVCYSHNGTPVAGATVALDGNIKTTTNSDGYFSFTHTETTPGVMNHTITATADGINRIVLCSLSQILQVEWVGFWTPVTIAIVIGSVAAVVIVVAIVVLRMRKLK